MDFLFLFISRFVAMAGIGGIAQSVATDLLARLADPTLTDEQNVENCLQGQQDIPSKVITQQIDRANMALLRRTCPSSIVRELEGSRVLERASAQVLEDLLCLTAKDPAAKNSPRYVWDTYFSFQAVRYYRLAHQLDILAPANEITPFKFFARRISEEAKVLTGVEIHPAAKIGRRFVVDHGFGTVIGETTEIGDDCYILHGVTLGAGGISSNPNRKRHPTLGNRVQVGAFVSILGDVTVGDDVKIAPHAVVKENIPANSKVLFLSTHQIIRN